MRRRRGSNYTPLRKIYPELWSEVYLQTYISGLLTLSRFSDRMKGRSLESTIILLMSHVFTFSLFGKCTFFFGSTSEGQNGEDPKLVLPTIELFTQRVTHIRIGHKEGHVRCRFIRIDPYCIRILTKLSVRGPNSDFYRT